MRGYWGWVTEAADAWRLCGAGPQPSLLAGPAAAADADAGLRRALQAGAAAGGRVFRSVQKAVISYPPRLTVLSQKTPLCMAANDRTE